MTSALSLFSNRNVLPIFTRSGAGRPTVDKGGLLDLYNLLEAYYQNNGLYETAAAIYGETLQPESLAALRTPARRVVEFYTGAIWPGALPGALPISTENDRIIDPIHQVWLWSNWATKKQLAIRRFAIFGDMILKIARRDRVIGEDGLEVITEPSSVFIEVINPKHVPEGGLILDERGNVTYIRIDVPKTRLNDSGTAVTAYTHTEIWDRQTYRRYEHSQGFNAKISAMGLPLEEVPLEEFGIDFVPFVYAPFCSIDDLARGVGAYTLALEKIDEVNRMTTRLHYLLFRYNKSIWALASNMVDSAGRPIVVSLEEDAGGVMSLGDDEVLKLPGNATLESLVPGLAYDQYLAAIEGQAAELERDLPELAYSRLREKGELSGRAINLLLGDAIARAIEARGNAEDALVRAHKIALTMGQAAGLFENIGTYEAGDYDHAFIERPIIRTTELDRAEVSKAYRDQGLALETTLARAGWQKEEIDEALADIEAERNADQTMLATAALEAARQYEAGQATNGADQPGGPNSPNLT